MFILVPVSEYLVLVIDSSIVESSIIDSSIVESSIIESSIVESSLLGVLADQPVKAASSSHRV